MPPDGMSESNQKAVHLELDRILKSGPFLQSRRRQRFLEYIVAELLAGRGERLKGYNVARDVFDRSEAFDPNVDPTVRMEAGRLRDRLREYYETDGRSDPIRIDLPKGTYTPQLEFRKAEAFEDSSQERGQHDNSRSRRRLHASAGCAYGRAARVVASSVQARLALANSRVGRSAHPAAGHRCARGCPWTVGYRRPSRSGRRPSG